MCSEQSLTAMSGIRNKVFEAIRIHFKVSGQLYFEFTDLTRRTPSYLPFSHTIHSDTCQHTRGTDECEQKETFCCSWVSHSSVLYLNDHDGGGRLFFADKHHIPVLKVEPQAGRLGNAPSTSRAFNLIKYQFHSNVRITQRRVFAWSVPCYQW